MYFKSFTLLLLTICGKFINNTNLLKYFSILKCRAEYTCLLNLKYRKFFNICGLIKCIIAPAGSISSSLEYLDPFLEFNPFSPINLPQTEEDVVTAEPKPINQTCQRRVFPWDFIQKRIVEDKIYSRSCKRVKCTPKNITDILSAKTKVLNSSQSINTFSMNNRSGDVCVVVMFYANWCRFSAKAAPHYNALGRIFYNLDVVAIDGVHFNK